MNIFRKIINFLTKPALSNEQKRVVNNWEGLWSSGWPTKEEMEKIFPKKKRS